MKQKIITSRSAEDLNSKIEEMQAEGWEPMGSHQVVTESIQNTIRADSVIVRSQYANKYSQTMVKK